VVGWGWYYISTVLDDDSRKILAWKLGATMRAEDVVETLERAIARFVDHYNDERLHEAIGNVTPGDMYHGHQHTILSRRERFKRLTLERRKKEDLRNTAQLQTGAGTPL
jgi:transposase InsO family protein